ncbi:MAG: hypothetical protein AB7O52_12960 [Planctomycetota bacterium]
MIFVGSLGKWVVGGVLVAVAAAGGSVLLFSRRDPLPALGRLQDLVYQRVTEQLTSQVVAPPGTERLLIPPIARDATEALRARVGRATEQRTGLTVLLPKRDESVADDFSAVVGSTLGSWKSKIVAEWTGEKPELVLACRVVDLVNDDERVRLDVEWEQQWVASGEPLAGGKVTEEVTRSWSNRDYARAAITDSSAALRLGLWLAVLVIPSLLLTRWIRRVLREESNARNAALVLAVALPGCVAGWVLTGFGVGWFGGGLTLLAAAASGGYSFAYCSWIEDLRR